MKKHLNKKAVWMSFLSLVTLGIFILLAVGSSSFVPPSKTISIGKGYHQETYFTWRSKRVTTGKHDADGRWVGTVKSVWTGSGGRIQYTEEAMMLYGMREGPCTVTYPNKKVETYIYHQDQKMPKYKTTQSGAADASAFGILYNKYPWFLLSMDACGYDSIYVEAFMDTVETMLNTYPVEIAEFDNYYEDVMDQLEDTPYDSIITVNSDFFLIKGMEELKNAELRLAVIDRYRTESNTTYEVVSSTYPGYLRSLNDSAITNHDFEVFCQDLDSCMESYGVLDPQDTLFIDSLDVRFLRAIYAIMDVEDSASSSMQPSVKRITPACYKDDFRGIVGNVSSILRPLILESTPKEVGTIVVSSMLMHLIKGDILRRVIRESWSVKNGVIRIPTAATVFSEFNSATSVTLHGYVLDKGGSELSTSGMAWASFYNPTVDDNLATRETGTAEDFTVRLVGLNEGDTYYARTYATNAAGVAYGNCISFVAAAPSDLDEINVNPYTLLIYPNPASALTTFCFQLASPENVVLTIVDMKGHVVLSQDHGLVPGGNSQIKIDLSGLPDGTYMCTLTNGAAKITQKFLIAH